MNDHDEPSELPELSDDDVEILYAVCKRAAELNEPPFKALFAALDEVRATGRIDAEHDATLSDCVMRIGDAAKRENSGAKAVDLVKHLRSYLETLGITVVDPPEDEEDDYAETNQEPLLQQKPLRSRRRRVSFDDANFEETWLSEHSRPINPPALTAPRGLLNLPARRGRNAISERQARSTSEQRELPARRAAPKSSQHNLPSADDALGMDHHRNPTLYFEPSQTQLELNAEVFSSTSALRSARQALHAWHSNTLRLEASRSQAYSRAAAHDRRTLLKQAFDQWRSALSARAQQQRKERHLEKLCERAKYFRDRFLLNKAFTHWAMSCEEEQLRTKVAQRHVLRVTYFQRWRAIASENQAKVRRILVRKYLAVWREKTVRRLLWEEQAEAYYEERLLKKCKSAWFWQFCSRRVEGWHEQGVEKKGFRRLVEGWQAIKIREGQAEQLCGSNRKRRVLRALSTLLRSRRDDAVLVQERYERRLALKCLSTLRIRAKLQPLSHQVAQKVDENTKRKALDIWRHNLALSHQADQVNRNRLLQNAWTQWNDSLRCKALAQRIDERVLMENLYRWILQERLSLFRRTTNDRLLGRVLAWWRGRVVQERDQLADAEIVFQKRQRRRRLAFGVQRLNLAAREREDVQRAALEFANGRALPKTLQAWKQRSDHARQLAKWADDARFYCLCSGALRVWKERTSEHKATRRREAYVHVRARVKIALVSKCFGRWRAACTEIRSMKDEAERRAEARVHDVAASAFTHWQTKTDQYTNLAIQALDLDHQHLLTASVSALAATHTSLANMDLKAVEFQQATDLSLLAGALRRLQWATFTASRKVESADALWARNRDQHIRHMLRHWAAQTAVRRAAAAEGGIGDVTDVQDGGSGGDGEVESPSLRPASRAHSRSAIALPSSPPTQFMVGMVGATPSYLRTPSRPRRAGRFRPLPTPAPFTPMAFDDALLATTPTSTQPYSEGQAFEGLTPQVTPFSRKLRAGGFGQGMGGGGSAVGGLGPASALRSSRFRRSVQVGTGTGTGIGTGKSVRFAGNGRFGKRAVGEGDGS